MPSKQKTGHNHILDAALYIVATPIGNLGDMSARGIEVLKAVEVIACEDTRVSKKLLNHFGIKGTLLSYHEHNAAAMRPKLMDRLLAGESVALISDAGTPLISDPGYKLVSEVQAAGITVIPVPGASAVMASLMACGLPTDQFAFLGFLPNQQSHILALLANWQSVPATLVCFTTPGKVAAHLAAVVEVFGACDVAIGRELTKLHEEFIRGNASELLKTLAERDDLRGEMVMAFRACEVASTDQLSAQKMDDLLHDLLTHMPLKAAVDVVVRHTGQPKNQVYQRALELRE